MNTDMNKTMTVHLSTLETENIYRRQKQLYWETDFLNRCLERRQENHGLCNLPYDTLADEKALLNLAYEIYMDTENSNTAYNVTLDLVIDEIEKQIRDNKISFSKTAACTRIAIVIENGIISAVLTTDPDIQIEFTELDRDYADSDLCAAVYDALANDTALSSCSYSLKIPGYNPEIRLELP